VLLGLAQERRVESVAVRGLRNISETAVIAALRLKPGEPFTEATLESDRRAIEAMGLFSDVRPRVEGQASRVRWSQCALWKSSRACLGVSRRCW